MHQWGWSGAVAQSDVTASIVALAKRRGFEVRETAKSAAVITQISASSDGRVLVVGSGIAGDAIARELSRAFSVDGRYAEVDLDDAAVSASARDVGADGSLGPEQDLDELVTETCEEWFEGKKYRSEATSDLVAMCLGFDDGPPSGGVELAFHRGGSARVVTLLDAVRGGARWEKTSMAGRTAVKVRGVEGTRISVLDDAELTQFEEGLAAGP